jgi:DNA-binding NarL/FixJ family response regulator
MMIHSLPELPETEIATGAVGAAAFGGGHAGTRHSIWLVDDNAMSRGLCAEMLQMEGGFEVARQFGSAEAVISALRQTPGPELMLLDVNLPEMSGATAVKFIKSLSPATNVFMFSTVFDPPRAAEARAGGASGYLRKSHPFGQIMKTLRLAVDSILTSS